MRKTPSLFGGGVVCQKSGGAGGGAASQIGEGQRLQSSRVLRPSRRPLTVYGGSDCPKIPGRHRRGRAQQGFPYALCRPASRRRAGKERFSEEKSAVRRPFLTAWVVPVGRPLPFGTCRCLRDGVPMLYVAALFPRTGVAMLVARTLLILAFFVSLRRVPSVRDADCVLKRWSATVVPSSWKLRRLFHALPCQGRGRSAGCTERGPWIAQNPKPSHP